MIERADTGATRTGSDLGGVIPILRAEGAAAVVASLLVYGHGGGGWIGFAILFFVPDLSLLAYLVSGRVGASVYNCAHTYVCPALLAGVGWAGGVSSLCAGALIWIAHIGFDRALGYGLKRRDSFRDTHLGAAGVHDGSAR